MIQKNVIGIVGSLREKSFNKFLMQEAVLLAPETMHIEIMSIGDFPLYNMDIELSNYPEVATNLKEKIRHSDGVIFATPEYNRTIPGVLKNAIDWISRPYGTSPFSGKPVYVMGATTGQVGTALSQYNLKQALLYLDAHVFGQPEFYMAFAEKKFNVEGKIIDEASREVLEKALLAFASSLK